MELDIERFQEAASYIRAEQFLQEKFAEAPIDPVAVVSLARALEVEDPELLKVAHAYCPQAPLEFYEHELGGKFKEAAGFRVAAPKDAAAASLKGKGLERVKQLFTGSRKKGLEGLADVEKEHGSVQDVARAMGEASREGTKVTATHVGAGAAGLGALGLGAKALSGDKKKKAQGY